MKKIALRNGLILASLFAGMFLSAGAMAGDDDTIARGGERMGGERRPGGNGQGRYGGEYHPQEYHPAESEAARQDINRNQDLRNLNNNAVPEGYPAYTPAPGMQGGGSTVNINTAPQSTQR